MKLLLKAKPKERLSLGLDIGTSTAKLVKLRFYQDKVELCDFKLEPTQAELNQTLKTVTQSQEIKRVNISVSGPATIIRYVNFPRMGNNELKQGLKFEAPKYITFPIAEANLDSFILKPDLPDNKMLVLFAAVRKELVNQRLKLMEEAGLKTDIIDIDSLALINAFNFNYPKGDDNLKNKSVALLNIGASMSNVNILEDSLPVLSRDIYIAGNNLTQQIADTLGMDSKTAEQWKLKPDKESLDKVIAAIKLVLSHLAAELRTSIDYYESQSASTVERIFLSGGSSLFTGLKDMLANLLGIEVEYWDPLRQINISNNINLEEVKALSSQLAVAIGLALRK
jgi:type IV pilus assembly protein PilM